MKTLRLIAIILLFAMNISQAADVFMTDNDGSGASSLTAAGKWSNLAAPSGANNYFTSNYFVRTPPSGSVTFAGNSLTLQPPQGQATPMRSMLFKGGNNSVTTINNLTNAGGVINAASGNVLGIFNGNAMYVISNSTIQADQGPFLIGYPLFGSGDLTNTSGQARTITYTNNNSGFTGRFIINNNVTVALAHPNSAPGNPPVPTPDQITLGTTATLSANTNITLNNPNGGVTLIADATMSFGSAGITLAVNEPITGPFILTKRGGGILTLGGDNIGLGAVTLLTFTAGSQLNINSPTAIGSGTFTLGSGAVAPALLDNTSGSALTLSTGNSQVWSSGLTFLGSSSLNMGGGSVSMTADVTATVSNNVLTVGSVSDMGGQALTKRGPGTLVINGDATYVGNTLVAEGTLTITGSTLNSPFITVSSNATLNMGTVTLNPGQTLAGSGTIAGNVAAGSSTTINPGTSAGTLTVNGNLALTGPTTLNFELNPIPTVGSGVNDLIVVLGELNIAGPVTLNILGATGSSVTYTLIQYNSFNGNLANVSAPSGYTLTNNTAAKTIQLISSHVATSLTWAGDGTLNAWDIGLTANWLQSGTNQFFYNSDIVTFTESGDNTVPVNLASELSPGAVIVTAAKNYTLTGHGITSGSLTMSGSGTLILDNTNSYTGPTIINSGTLQLGDPFGGSGGLAGTVGSGPVTNNGVLQFYRSSDVTITPDITGSGSISNFGGSGTVTLEGRISGSASVSQVGSGLRLAGSNDYTGLTIVSSGALFPRHTNALGSISTGTIVYSGGTLYFDLNQPMDFAAEPLTLDGGTLRRGGAQTLTFEGPVTITASGGTLSADGGSTLTLSNVVSGTGSLSKNESGTVVLAVANNYSGSTLVNGGTLMLANNAALGSSAGIAVSSTAGGAGLSGTRITLSGGLNIGGKSLLLPSSGAGTVRSALFGTGAGVTNTWSGPITISGDGAPIGEPANQVAFGVDNDSTLIVSGNVASDGSFFGKLNIRGGGGGSGGTGIGIITGTVNLSSEGQIQLDDGATWIIASTGHTWATNRLVNGTLRLGVNNGLPTGSYITDGARLDLAGFNQTIAGLNAACTITNSSVTADSTLIYSSTGTSTNTGSFRDGARKLNVTIASGNLTLTSPSTLTIPKSTVNINSGATLELDYFGTNQVFGLVLNGVSQPPGIYDAINATPYIAGTGSLLVQPGPSGPALLTNSVSGNVLTLSWPAGESWRLQMQTNSLAAGLRANWDYITDGSVNTTNITIDRAQPAVFYRLVFP